MCGLIFPGDRYMKFPDYDAYGSGYDLWGVKWQNMGPNPGKDGSTVFPGFKVLVKDVGAVKLPETLR